jgi:hypothetical protein
MLNRERVVASLAFLILVFGIYSILDSRLASPLSPVSTAMPDGVQPLAQIEPRLYYEDLGGSQSPYQPASDWMPYTAEDLPAPVPEPSRWLVLPLSRSADPADAGYLFLKEPPVEAKGGSDDPVLPAVPSAGSSPPGPPEGKLEGAVAPSRPGGEREQASSGSAGFRSERRTTP